MRILYGVEVRSYDTCSVTKVFDEVEDAFDCAEKMMLIDHMGDTLESSYSILPIQYCDGSMEDEKINKDKVLKYNDKLYQRINEIVENKNNDNNNIIELDNAQE